jgi:1-deoxyxylulose-5-phosphate synthase
MIPWSPIARGRLARPVGAETPRMAQDAYQKYLFDRTQEADAKVIAAVQSLAQELGRPMAHVALAWVRQKTGVTAPIIGITKAAQLNEAIDGLTTVLTREQMQRLEEPYIPHAPLGQE